MENFQSRRSFFGKMAVAGGAYAAGAVSSKAAEAKKRPVKNPSTELLRVGAIALGPNSHMNYSIWAPMINPTEPDIWPTRTTRMQITHCWDSRPDIAQDFAKKYKCEAVKNYYDMVGKVDGMIFAGFNEVKWWPQLSKPYLEAGIPCILNRPFAYSLKDANEIINTAKKYNTPILCPDEREYFKEASVGRWKVTQLLKEGKTIIGAVGNNASGEYPQHAVHGLYYMLAIFGLDVDSVSFLSDGWWHEKTITSPNHMNCGVLSVKFNGIKIEGVNEQKRPFIFSQQQFQHYIGSDTSSRIYFDSGWYDLDQYDPRGEPMNRLYYLFFPAVIAIQRLFETRKMQWSYDYILQKTRIFLAGFKSHLEHNGGWCKVDDVPYEWEAPSPYPDYIDESIFKG